MFLVISAQWLHSGMRHKTWTPCFTEGAMHLSLKHFWSFSVNLIQQCQLVIELSTSQKACGSIPSSYWPCVEVSLRKILNLSWPKGIHQCDCWLKVQEKLCMNVCAIRWIRPGCSLASGLVHWVWGIYFYDELKFWIWTFLNCWIKDSASVLDYINLVKGDDTDKHRVEISKSKDPD